MAAFLWWVVWFLGFGVVFLVWVFFCFGRGGWVAEGFCEFIVTCRPEFARGCMGDATSRDSATKKKGETKYNIQIQI